MYQKRKTPSQLDSEIDRVLSYMKDIDPSEDDYDTVVSNLSKLHALKVAESPKRISPDTWLTTVAHVAGIVLVLHYEKANIIPKALTLVKKVW